jgi:hypothetical protein
MSIIDNDEETLKAILTSVSVKLDELDNIGYQLERIADGLDRITGHFYNDTSKPGFIRTSPVD